MWKKWKKERKRDFTREIYDLSRGLFKTKFIRNETKDTIARVYLSFFFFFFRCYHRGTFDVANVLSSRETYPYLNLTSCRWYFESGIFLNPQKYSFFFLMKILFFFFPSAAEILIKQFICDGNCRRNGIGIVFQFIHISFADLLVNSIVKKKKKTDISGVIFKEFYLPFF